MFICKRTFSIFLSLLSQEILDQWFSKWSESLPWRQCWGARGDKTKGGDRWETTQREEKHSTTNQSL